MHCNPVVVSYLLITQDDVIYFISPEKVTKEVNEYLKEQHVKLKNYDEVETYLNTFTGRNILIDPKKTNFAIYSAINPKCNIIRGESPVALLKAIRNEQEIAGIHAAMQRMALRSSNSSKWLEEAVPSGKETELSVDRKLHEFRAAQPFIWERVSTLLPDIRNTEPLCITPQLRKVTFLFNPKVFFFLDSGSPVSGRDYRHYRTIALGELTEEEKNGLYF